MRNGIFKTPVLAIFLFLGLGGNAQTSGGFGDGIEITISCGAAKQNSNSRYYDSKYKPPDWWTFLWYWAREIAKFLYGSGKSEVDDAFPYNPAAARTSSFGAGAGVGIGTKGGKLTFGTNDIRNTIYYLELALMGRYNHALDNGGDLFAALGPYYAVALAGRSKTDAGKENLKFGNGNDADFRRGDMGLKFILGFKPQSLPVSIGVTGDLGLRNLTPGGGNTSAKNRYYGIQVGYALGR